jgi:hypothetical protein
MSAWHHVSGPHGSLAGFGVSCAFVVTDVLGVLGYRCFTDENGVSKDRSAVPPASLREYESGSITFRTIELELGFLV